MDIEQRINLGSRAYEVLNNEAYIAAFNAIKTEITTSWEKSPARDQEGREKLWLMLTLLQKVQTLLESTMASGKVDQSVLQHRKTVKQKAKELIGME